METFMHAIQFAAYKHRFQKRKDADRTPYINHPIGVAYILSNEAGIKDYDLLSVCNFDIKISFGKIIPYFRLHFYMTPLKIQQQHLMNLKKNLDLVLLVFISLSFDKIDRTTSNKY